MNAIKLIISIEVDTIRNVNLIGFDKFAKKLVKSLR